MTQRSDEQRAASAKTRLYRGFQVDPISGCWNWTKSTLGKGYGKLSAFGKRAMGAHVVSYIVHYGPIPENLRVLHECDNPRCVNPKHLKIGTQADNVRDMVLRGRQYTKPMPGASNSNARLTEVDVEWIRSADFSTYGSGMSAARKFGVTYATIRNVRKGITWNATQ